MLLHIRPRCFSPFREVELVDLTIACLGITLIGGKDLATRRPYPNKRYAVACRKRGLRATDGILIETPERLCAFTMVCRWAVNAEFVARHEVHYLLVDQEFDTASDNMCLWYGTRDWSSRWSDDISGTPASAAPRMDIEVGGGRVGDVTDTVDAHSGWIFERRETFRMPTLERSRLTGHPFSNDRSPGPDSAFLIDGKLIA